MKLNKSHYMGIVVGLLTFAASAFFWNQKIFYFLIGIGLIVVASPFVMSSVIETERTKEKEEMFLSLTRDLVESVNSGTPISKSIINLRGRSYGSLTVNVEKLINQIGLGITVKEALENFARDVNISTISRAVATIKQAEEAGGDIGTILESVTNSINEMDKLTKERRAAISNLVVQGYIIFFIFIVIILIMQFKIVPMLTVFGNTGGSLQGSGFGSFMTIQQITPEELSTAFLGLLIAQGLFAGLVIGKLSEGNLKAGIKHSFFLVVISILIFTGANAFITPTA